MPGVNAGILSLNQDSSDHHRPPTVAFTGGFVEARRADERMTQGLCLAVSESTGIGSHVDS